jgi:hypothetical protein
VESPPGFEGDFFRLGEISLDVDPASLSAGVVPVDEVVVATPEVLWVVGTREAKLPPLTLRDLGEPDGAPAGEIGARVAEAYLGRVARTVAMRELGRRIGEALDGEAGEAGRALEGFLERSRRP